jgi:2-oxoglutarate dehydrogenase E1 component
MDSAEAPFGSQNLAFVEQLYAQFLRDAESVPRAWREYFGGLPEAPRERGGLRLGPSFRRHSVFNPPASGDGHGVAAAPAHAAAVSQDRVDQLIRNYRVRGHIIARTPLHHHQPYRRVEAQLLRLAPPISTGRFRASTSAVRRCRRCARFC